MKERIKYIDYLKTIAIFMVCFCHSSFLLTKTDIFISFIDIICYAGVPIFFMVNGALLLNSNFNTNKHYKKTLNIIIVFLCWEILTGLYMIYLNKVSISSISFQNILNYLISGQQDKIPDFGHFWFMRTLILIYLVYPLIKFTYDHKDGQKYLYIFCTIIFLLSFAVNTCNSISAILNHLFNTTIYNFDCLKIYIPANTNNSGQCIFFFIIGAMLHKSFFIDKINKNYIKSICTIALILGWIGLFIIKVYETGLIDKLNNLSFGYDRISTVLISCSIFLLILHFDNKVNKSYTIIEDISKNTLGIYYLHIILSNPIRKVICFFNSEGIMSATLLESLSMILLSLIIIKITKRIPLINRLFQN